MLVSNSIDTGLAAAVGAFGLSASALLLATVVQVWHGYTLGQSVKTRFPHKVRNGSSWTRALGICSAIGCWGLGCFNQKASQNAHDAFAASFFLFGVAYILGSSYIDILLGTSRGVLILRWLLAVIAACSTVVFLALEVTATSEDSPFRRNLSVTLQLSILFLMLLHLATRWPDLWRARVEMMLSVVDLEASPTPTSHLPSEPSDTLQLLTD
mmetsp:Transcript_47402/g.111577  ORF Transcript_47402/g.111577 Transcript_47402/m.111577 type:complete len:212 (-) Transcript_47402:315-950(-)